MKSSVAAIPNFAGIALVDILANGVAVLIIVIVLSIAARADKEQRYTEKVQEVAAVMTREFSTSLVLNKLAASPPALLHDYENSEIDQIWDPDIMPVLEFHRNVVRDPYTGTIWTRNELLESPNTLDTFLLNMNVVAKHSVRGDIYDVGTYYLLMSILNDHGIRISHWHFIGGVGGGDSFSSIANCPPGVSFQDCTGGAGMSGMAATELPSLPGLDPSQGDGDQLEGSNGGDWPPSEFREDGEAGSETGGQSGIGQSSIPGGSRLGEMSSENLDPSGMGSFPNARRMPRGGSSSGTGSGMGPPGPENSIQLRLADPDSQTQDDGFGLPIQFGDADQIVAAVMLYLSDIQEMLDKGRPPTEMLRQFQERIVANFERLDELTPEQTEIVEDLLVNLDLVAQAGSNRQRGPIPITLVSMEDLKYSALRVLPNRLLLEAEALIDQESDESTVDWSVPVLSLNAYPDIWRGLRVSLSQGSVLLKPPASEPFTEPRWFTVAYLSPQMDDVIVGFVFGTVDPGGTISIVADSNQVRIGSRDLVQTPNVAFFGVKTWLVTFYVALALMLIALLLFWRPGLRRTQ